MAESSKSSETEAAIQLPGLGDLREAVANYLIPQLPKRRTLRQDVLGGLSTAISNVPDGMANGALVGVNPVYGLYAITVGPLVGGLFSSTELMVITTAAAASLATAQALGNRQGEAREAALFALVVIVGLLQVAAGLLRLGRLTRFVSYSVMTGFLTGIAVLLATSQVPTVAGYAAEGNNRIMQAIDVLAHLGEINWTSLALAALTLVLAFILPRTALRSMGTLAAIVIPSVLAALFGLESVELVRDVGELGGGIPMPVLPSLSVISLDVLTGALAVAIIILVQGAGVSQSVPNPDGSRRSASRDFIGQGAANIASGFFRGLPVAGSQSATALGVIYGLRSRWGVIFSGIWAAVAVVVFPGLVGYIAMPSLGAVLILAGARSVKLTEMVAIWKTGWASRIVSLATFVATLFLTIQAAVGLGVVLSALLYLFRSSNDISIVELVKHEDGRIEERAPDKRLADNQVTVLEVYGSLFYGGAHTFERLLPKPAGSQNPVVILRLRGHTGVGATLIEVLTNYASKLREVNGRLYLTGVNDRVYDTIVRTGRLRLTGPVRAYAATPYMLESTHEAVADARTWLVGLEGEAAEDASSDNGA